VKVPNTRFSFIPALKELGESDQILWGPKDFPEYVINNDFDKRIRAPEVISVDSLESLRPELKENNVMVLRLGKSSAKGTQLGLVKTNSKTQIGLSNSSAGQEYTR